jgi:hypothetical protein
VRDARDESGQRRQCPNRILVSGVARAADPRPVGVIACLGGPVRAVGGYTDCPRNRPQRNGFQHWTWRCGSQVVVVGQREVEVVGQQLEGLDRFVLTDDKVDLRVCLGELGENGQQREPDLGGEAADPYGAGRPGVWAEIEACAVDGRQNGDGVVRKA